jgi:hypothetical protein
MREGETASFPKIRHLEQIARIADEDKQAELLSYTISEGWTTEKLKQKVDQELGINPREKKVQQCNVCDSPEEDFKTFKMCGLCSAEFLTWLQDRKEKGEGVQKQT